MHITRAELNNRIPVPRKGTKYIARASSNARDGVPVVVAVRDMLKIAKTAREVNIMVKDGLLKLNGRKVRDLKEGIRLFNVLETDNKYKLVIMKTGKFNFEETKEDFRVCKVIGKKTLDGNKTQINLHDGTNFLSKEKIKVGDSVHVGFDNKVKKIIALEKGKEAFVISGRSVGNKGRIKDVDGNNVDIQLEERVVRLDKTHIIVI